MLLYNENTNAMSILKSGFSKEYQGFSHFSLCGHTKTRACSVNPSSASLESKKISKSEVAIAWFGGSNRWSFWSDNTSCVVYVSNLSIKQLQDGQRLTTDCCASKQSEEKEKFRQA
jgi:hypothetical protein